MSVPVCLEEQGHLWVYLLHPLDLSNYECAIYPPLFQRFPLKFLWNASQGITNLFSCTTFHRYPIFSTRYSVMCKVYTGYCGTSEIEHGFCACTVDNPLAKARGLSLRTGAQPMLYLPLVDLLQQLVFSGTFLKDALI